MRQALELTFDAHVPEVQGVSKGRQVCGVLQCTETLLNVQSDQGNHSKRITSLVISKNRLNHGGAIGGRWQQLASVTPQEPLLSRVSDGTKVTGKLSDHKAELTLEFVKTHDCQESRFSCVAVYLDDQDRASLTKSFVGKAVDSLPDISRNAEAATVSVPVIDGPQDDQFASATSLTQLLNFFQMRFDWIGSRLDDSLKALENRLEDKVGDFRAALENKINNLENRVEDKLTHLQILATNSFGQTRSTSHDNENLCTQLDSKLDRLETNVADKMNTCVSEVTKQTKNANDAKVDVSGQLTAVINSIKSVEMNLTYCDANVDKLDTAVEQWTRASTAKEAKLNGLVSSVSALSHLTQNLNSQIITFRNSYAAGALVQVEEFFDPLDIGRKEWRLVFRGTAYNSIKLYPAYIHGTGIPVEVEEGCKQFNRSLPCVNHYRNTDAFDNWTDIDEVLFAVYKNGQIVKRIVFNGKGSTPTDWFAASRVIFSSWNDLVPQPHNHFSLRGFEHTDPAHDRRFYINLDHNQGCNGFRGWFYVKDKIEPGCTADKTVSVPMIQYAAGNTFAVWTGSNIDRADAIGIFVKYE